MGGSVHTQMPHDCARWLASMDMSHFVGYRKKRPKALLKYYHLSSFQYNKNVSRKDRRRKILLNTNRMFRPHGLPQQNREESGEERSYIPVPRQRDIGAPVPGTVKQVGGGGVEEVKGSDWRMHGERGSGYIPVLRNQCTGARCGKTSKRGIRSRRNEEIGLTHAQGENEKYRNWHRKYRNRQNHVQFTALGCQGHHLGSAQ